MIRSLSLRRFASPRVAVLRITVVMAFAALLAGVCYCASVRANAWQGTAGSYADSNPLTIPILDPNFTAAKGWQNYE